MTTTIHPTRATPSRPVLRSIGAVVAAFLVMVILTGITDQILHWLGVFPPWGQVTYEPLPYVFAVLYRTLFGVVGAYLAARWAPRAPMRHALALGAFGVVLSLVGVIAAMTRNLGPVWYPILLVVVSLPASWAGGALYGTRAR